MEFNNLLHTMSLLCRWNGFGEHFPINCWVPKRWVAKEVSNYAFGKQTPDPTEASQGIIIKLLNCAF